MSQELFYTSAPRGLQPGSTGFCTVAETRGLSPLLRERLEDLSGYRELFPPHDPRAGQNPVARSHVRLSLQGKTVSVLSRVGAAGVDHSQRTNKFAHHVVLDGREQVAAGPAALLARPGFLEATWDGQVRTLAAGRPVPAFDVPPAPCAGWQRITGDAGWAGALVDAYLNNRPAYVLYPLGLDVLPLLVEALALLPVDRRWFVTFTTYFTAVPSGSPCAWRCLPLESPGVAEALRAPGALVLRLDGALGPAPAGPAADAARAGQMLAVAPTVVPPGLLPPGGRPAAPRSELAPRAGTVAVVPGPEAPQAVAELDLPQTDKVYLEPPRPRGSFWRGFPGGVVTGFLMAALLGVGVLLGAGIRPTGGVSAGSNDDGREAEISRKVAEARKQWEEKDLPVAVERGRKERAEELQKEVQIARNLREFLQEPTPRNLEDKEVFNKTLNTRIAAAWNAQDDARLARQCKEQLPEIFPGLKVASLADAAKSKEELRRARTRVQEEAMQKAVFEKEASLTKALAVLQFYFGFDEKAVADMDAEQLLANVQTRYVDLLKSEHRAEVELDNGNKARDEYKRFLAGRMDSWRSLAKGGVRNEAEIRAEAAETRKRLALEPRPDRADPQLERTPSFPFVTTWVITWFEGQDHYDNVLKHSRRTDLRKRAQSGKDDLTQARRSAIEELDRYLKAPPK